MDIKRCAIYTRKSSEEGLEQDFNSLHAQREACEAYITSQKHEGWKLIKTSYDDGGYEPPPINRSTSRVSLDRLWTIDRRARDGTEAVYSGADHRVFTAG